jgi:hypothetical protein
MEIKKNSFYTLHNCCARAILNRDGYCVAGVTSRSCVGLLFVLLCLPRRVISIRSIDVVCAESGSAALLHQVVHLH